MTQSSAASAVPPMWYSRRLIQRSLAFLYAVAFLIAWNQFPALSGPEGLLPIRFFLKAASWQNAPSLFLWNSSEFFIRFIAGSGLILSVLALSGFSEKRGTLFSSVVWALLWSFYLSIVNAGQTFYGFGWESLLLECGFLAIFLGSEKDRPSLILAWLYRWVLFRLMFGAGLIKLRGDGCWRDLTCMDYHYETQPLPNALSWFLHKLPPLWHKGEVLVTHFAELLVPFAYFIPGVLCSLAGVITIVFHLTLILSGNLSWLNYITIAAAFACFDNRALGRFFFGIRVPETSAPGLLRRAVLVSLLGLIAFKSILPAMNLISPNQKMNASFDPLHLVNTYGAFGGITRERFEIIIEGTSDVIPGPDTVWKEYEFKCKPGSTGRAPCLVSPYHYKLDWQMWFAAMNDFRYHPWILNLAAKLLVNDPGVLGLMAGNPFQERPPRYIRAARYRYRFSSPEEKAADGSWWSREKAGDYLPPLSLEQPMFRQILKAIGFETT